MPVAEVGHCIEASGVSKIYRAGTRAAVEAVSSVSFSVPHGQFVAILGPSGCGKSTLLMMVGGLEPLSGGSILIDGSPMTGPRTSIGIMFQDPTLLPWKSALDNILFPIRVLKRPIGTYHEAARNLLEQVGLAGFEHKKPHELSGGMRQRVAICRTLVYDPDLLLMDEPFSALDAISRDEMNELLLDLWQQYRKTALFVTHSIREAVLLADRALVRSVFHGNEDAVRLRRRGAGAWRDHSVRRAGHGNQHHRRPSRRGRGARLRRLPQLRAVLLLRERGTGSRDCRRQ